MDDQVINLGEYLRRREEREQEERSTFALWGGEGERSRFALPLWRAAYLAHGRRAALAWERGESGDGALRPFVVLDLWVEPARLDIPAAAVEDLRDAETSPACFLGSEGLGFYLGEREGRRWYLVIMDPAEELALEGSDKDDLFFLAGECAGLLFHREFDRWAEEDDEEDEED